MNIYTLKLVLHGISPMIWRRLRIPGCASLVTLHEIIQIVNHWDDDYLHQFHIYVKDYGLNYEGGLSFADNAHRVFLDDFSFDVGDKFTYEYNFFEHWLSDIRVENIEVLPQTTCYAYCISGTGMPGSNQYDEMEVIHKLLRAIVKTKKSTRMQDIRDLLEDLDAIRFNRKKINQRLAEVPII